MRICFVADARSPIARNWISYFIERRHDVHIISSYPCEPRTIAGAKLYQVPVALARFSRTSQAHSSEPGSSARLEGLLKRLPARLRGSALTSLSLGVQHLLLPVDLYRHVQTVRDLITEISPDLVHAMRIPFEGILAAKATPEECPLLISVWGNDFTLWAARNPIIGSQTRSALKRADALHCDCRRDLELATRDWGFERQKPARVLPGAGGIQSSTFHPGEGDRALRDELRITGNAPVVFNPRGFRGYVRNDIFFEAIPRVLGRYPEAIFICSGMQGHPLAEKWVRRVGVVDSVRLLPFVSRDRMAELFRLAQVAVSPSLHDGTPNTLLEAMACGCFPVAGDIESVREWIDDGVNGLLFDPASASGLAGAVIRAFEDDRLRYEAREFNLRSIAEKAEYNSVMRQAEGFYSEVVQSRSGVLKV